MRTWQTPRRHPIRQIVLLMLLIGGSGCADDPLTSIERIPTMPVSGQVSVDGVPAAFLQVEFNPDANGLIRYPVTTLTDESGIFHASTYETNDGLPEGRYKLTFRWVQPGISELDRLHKSYMDVSTSRFEVDVKSGGTNDVGKIDLKTKVE